MSNTIELTVTQQGVNASNAVARQAVPGRMYKATRELVASNVLQREARHAQAAQRQVPPVCPAQRGASLCSSAI